MLWYCNILLGVENIVSDKKKGTLLLSYPPLISDLKNKLNLCKGPDMYNLDHLDS